MAKKETTLNELGEMMSYVVESMATKDDIKDLATKEEMTTGFAGIMSELADIKRRLKNLEEIVADHSGHSKEIDHALERIAAIERHLGIDPNKNKKVSA